jgi:hypothetical protein
MVNIYRKQTHETRLFQIVVQSTKQEGLNYNISHKKAIWRTYYIKADRSTEQRIILQMHSIQHA